MHTKFDRAQAERLNAYNIRHGATMPDPLAVQSERSVREEGVCARDSVPRDQAKRYEEIVRQGPAGPAGHDLAADCAAAGIDFSDGQ